MDARFCMYEPYVCNRCHYFNKFCKGEGNIIVDNKETIASEGFKTVKIPFVVNNVECVIKIQNVQYAPVMMYSLTTSSKALRSGLKTSIGRSKSTP